MCLKISGIPECLELVRAVDCLGAVKCQGLHYVVEHDLLISKDKRCIKGCYSISKSELSSFNRNDFNDGNIRDFSFTDSDGRVFSVHKADWYIYSHQAKVCANGYEENISLKIHKLCYGNFPTTADYSNHRFRLIIPDYAVKNFRDFFPHGFRWNKDFRCWSSEMIHITIKGIRFLFYRIKYCQNSYLCIEADGIMPQIAFSKSATAILFGVGFIWQHICLDEEFLFEIDDKGAPLSMRYMSIRESISGQYSIFTTNAYSVLVPCCNRCNVSYDSRAKDWNTRLQPITDSVISQLCSLLYNSDDLLNVVSMIIESSRTGLEMQGAILSVVLETINKSISKIINVPGSPKPIENQRWLSLLPDLIDAVNKSSLTSEEKLFVIDRKIQHINSPTNIDSLTKCFSILGITLTSDEIKTVALRNKYLHGTLPVKDVLTESSKLISVGFSMHHLCCLLLLKLAGFSGYVINMQLLAKKDITESDLDALFRKI